MKSKDVTKIIALLVGLANVVIAGPKLVKDLPASNSTGPVETIVLFKTLDTKDACGDSVVWGDSTAAGIVWGDVVVSSAYPQALATKIGKAA
jgi:hypothetical protein